MIDRYTPAPRRRRPLLRRLFFAVLLGALVVTGRAEGRAGQDPHLPVPSISERLTRIGRDADGDYRIIEVLTVRFENSGADAVSVPAAVAVLRLQDGVDDLRGLGGDIPPDRVRHSPPDLILEGEEFPAEFQVALTYRMPGAVEEIELRSALAVAELRLELDRATLAAQPDRALVRDGEAGSPARPLFVYVATDLAPDSTVTIRDVPRRTSRRQRLTVLFALAGAVAAAGAYLLRVSRGRASGRQR